MTQFNVTIDIAKANTGFYLGLLDLHILVGGSTRRWIQVSPRLYASDEEARQQLRRRADRLADMLTDDVRDASDFYYDDSYQEAEPTMKLEPEVEVLTRMKDHTMAHLEALAENLDMPRDLTERTIGEKIAKEMLPFTGKITSWWDQPYGEGIVIVAENGIWAVATMYDTGELSWDKIDKDDHRYRRF